MSYLFKSFLIVWRGSFLGVDNLLEEAPISNSISVPDNLNEIEATDNNNDIDESANINDTEAGFDCPHEWKESDLWKQTKPITVIKDISKKIKARRASERRRYSLQFPQLEMGHTHSL